MALSRRHFAAVSGASALWGQAPPAAPALEWVDATTLRVEGLGYRDVKAPYDRLPARAEGVVRPAVWELSRESAGVLIRFSAATTALHARWELTKPKLAEATTTAVASSGLDLYAKADDGRWRWLGIGRPATFPLNSAALAGPLPPTQRDYMLYLPLHNGVRSLEIGVPAGSSIEAASPRIRGPKPIVFYGTSITHGYAASRPGMAHVAMLGRALDRPVINLGFGGNGRMELEVVRFLAELDAAVFVLDCLPNMTAKDVIERTEACVRVLRGARPNTPILLVEDRNYQDGYLIAARRQRNESSQQALRAVYQRMRDFGVPRLHYLGAADLLGGDGEGTVDGSHPTDLGFLRQASAFRKALAPLLRK